MSKHTQLQKKRRQKSPEDKLSDDFLKEQIRPFKSRLLMAWGLDTASVVVLIVQMALLARLFGGLLLAQYETRLTSILAHEMLLDALPVLVGCLLMRPVLGFWREKLVADTGLMMASRVRQQMLLALGRLSLARSRFGADGAIAGYVTDTPDELLGYARFSVQKMTAVSTPILIAIAIATKSLTAALVLIATAPLVSIFMAIIGIKTAKKSREQMEALARLGGSFLDWIRGMNTLKRLSAVDGASLDIQKNANEYKERTMSVLKIAFLNSTVLELLSALSIALVAVYLGFGLMGILPWQTGQMLTSHQTALFILLLAPEFYAPLRRLGAEYHAKGQATAAAKILAPIVGSSISKTPDTLLADSPYQIHMANVSVKTDERVRLSQMSLSLKTGDKVALIGRSGSGKTTIFQVLLGVCDYEGEVGVSASQLGYLPQTPSLLPVSIADNLRLAKPSVTGDELQVVLEQVGLWGLVSALPMGINTILTERGGGLSGGQAQRLAIAQLVLQDASVWLLDEPTEHLDKDTKADIHELLHHLGKSKTILWATHDEPVAWMDSVIRLDGGAI